MKRRRTYRPDAVLTRPVQAVGIAADISIKLKRVRAPNLSHNGPNRNRMTIVPPTPIMDEVQISSFDKFKVSRISARSGVIENQRKKELK